MYRFRSNQTPCHKTPLMYFRKIRKRPIYTIHTEKHVWFQKEGNDERTLLYRKMQGLSILSGMSDGQTLHRRELPAGQQIAAYVTAVIHPFILTVISHCSACNRGSLLLQAAAAVLRGVETQSTYHQFLTELKKLCKVRPVFYTIMRIF